jgi:hypothetical protein
VIANLNESSVLDREAKNRVDRIRGHVLLTLSVARMRRPNGRAPRRLCMIQATGGSRPTLQRS